MKSKCTFKPIADGGFTLMELLVTVGIIAVTAAIGAPHMGKVFSAAPENEEIEILRGALQEVRNRAITGDNCATVRVVSATQIRTDVYASCGPPLGAILTTKNYTFNRLTLANFSSGPVLQFVSTGGTTEAGPSTLQIITETNKGYEVTVMPAIGNIRIKKN